MGVLTWTDEQLKAINFPDQDDLKYLSQTQEGESRNTANLLVSAAAGSGKTAVLSERIKERAIRQEIDLSRLLVVTFTELAAKQMHNKIEKQLIDIRDQALAREKMPERTAEEQGGAESQVMSASDLEKLLLDLQQAQISTIHAFCNRILDAYLAEFKDANNQPYLEPGYSILEDDMAEAWREEAVDKVFSDLYIIIDAYKDEAAEAELKNALNERFETLDDTDSLSERIDDFERLSRAYASRLSDEPLRDAVIDILNKLRNLPDYRNFLKREINKQQERINQFPSNDFLNSLLNKYYQYVEQAKKALKELSVMPHHERVINPKKGSKTDKTIYEDLKKYQNLIIEIDHIRDNKSLSLAEKYTSLYELSHSVSSIRMPSRRGGRKSQKTKNANAYIEKISRDIFPLCAALNQSVFNDVSDAKREEFIEGVEPLFPAPITQMQKELQESFGPCVRFFEIVLAVDLEFQNIKYKRNMIDFSDIEQGAYTLLQNKDIRNEVKDSFDEIYIDEYQDTSSIQDSIIAAIDKNNVFMVGDVKQSIYRFRYANPQLFQDKSDRFYDIKRSRGDQDSGYLLLLSKNFRSKDRIISFVNTVFSSCMTKEASEIEYDASHKLRLGRADGQGGFVTWRILTHANEEPLVIQDDKKAERLSDEEKLQIAADKEKYEKIFATKECYPQSTVDKMALLAADSIYTLVEQGEKLKNIAILCRTNDHCKQVRDVLETLAIPVTGRFTSIYPKNLIVRQFQTLLQLLDNPRQDTALASYLASPFAGKPLRPEEFMQINEIAKRLVKSNKSSNSYIPYFHERVFSILAADELAEGEKELQEKINLARNRARRWRHLANEINNYDLLRIIIQESSYEEFLEAGLFPQERLTQLEQFLDFVQETTFANFDSIQKLLQQLENLEAEDSFPDDSDIQEEIEAVRILTYHRSKGLQWPVVILMDLEDKQSDVDKSIINIDEQDGIRNYLISANGLSISDNFLNKIQLKGEEEQERAEAWRRLYVGMTRAEDKLFLLSAYNQKKSGKDDVEMQMTKMKHAPSAQRYNGEKVLPAEIIQGCDSYADVIWSSLLLNFYKEITEIWQYSIDGMNRGNLRLSKELVSDKLSDSQVSVLSGGLSDNLKAAQERENLEAANNHSLNPLLFDMYFEKIPYEDLWIKTAENIAKRAANSAISKEQISGQKETPENSQLSEKKKNDLIALLIDDMPNLEAARIPGKITVTEMKNSFEQARLLLDDDQENSLYDRSIDLDSYQEIKNKKNIEQQPLLEDMALNLHSTKEFSQEDEISATEKGSFIHDFLRYLELKPLLNIDSNQLASHLDKQVDRMIAKKQMFPEAKTVLEDNYPHIISYIKSDLVQRIVIAEDKGKVYREIPFTIALPASELDSSWSNDEITLLQGMIDLWFIDEDGKAVLLDFKSDRLPQSIAAQDKIIKERYALQLAAYTQAIEQATQRQVKEKIIWLIRADRAIDLADL